MDKENLIEGYFEGTLSEQQQKEFAALLLEDEAFKNEFEFQKQLKAAIILEKRAATKKVFTHFEVDLKQRDKKLKKRRLLSATAALILMVSLTFLFNINKDEQDLYGTFFQPFPNIEKPTVRGESGDDLISKAFQAYDAEDYNTSATLFEEIYQNDPSDFSILYLGISYMELGNFKKAISVFESYQDTRTSQYGGYISWYVSLSYLKENQTTKAKELLKILSESDHPMQQKSEELLFLLK